MDSNSHPLPSVVTVWTGDVAGRRHVGLARFFFFVCCPYYLLVFFSRFIILHADHIESAYASRMCMLLECRDASR